MTIERIMFLFYLVNAFLLGRVWDDKCHESQTILDALMNLLKIIVGLHLALVLCIAIICIDFYRQKSYKYNIRLTTKHFQYKKVAIVWSDRVSHPEGRFTLISDYMKKQGFEVNKRKFFTIIKAK
jgi:hypothetical protein